MPFPVLHGFSSNRFGSSVCLYADSTCCVRCPHELNSPGEVKRSGAVCQPLCTMNIWCHLYDVSSTLESLLSPDACFSLSGSDYRRGRVLAHRRTHGNHYRVGATALVQHVFLCAASSFFLCYSSSRLLIFHPLPDAVVVRWLAVSPLTHFSLKEETIATRYQFFHTCCLCS